MPTKSYSVIVGLPRFARHRLSGVVVNSAPLVLEILDIQFLMLNISRNTVHFLVIYFFFVTCAACGAQRPGLREVSVRGDLQIPVLQVDAPVLTVFFRNVFVVVVSPLVLFSVNRHSIFISHFLRLIFVMEVGGGSKIRKVTG
jgi:hypothetical protein